MQSAFGRIQLKRMPAWHEARTQNARDIDAVLSPFAGTDGPLRLTSPTCAGCDGTCAAASQCKQAYYKFYAFVQPDNLPAEMTRDGLVEHFINQGLPCFQGSCSEMYLKRAFDGTDFAPQDRLPVAKELGETSLMFLVHPGVTRVDVGLP